MIVDCGLRIADLKESCDRQRKSAGRSAKTDCVRAEWEEVYC